MPYRNYLITSAVLLIMLAIGYWGYDGSITTVGPNRTNIIRKDADYFLVSADIRQYNETGHLEYTLESSSITHYPHNDNTLLQQPVMLNYGNPGEVFKSISQSGKLLPGGNDIELWDNVIMTQTQLTSGKTVRMDTDFITIYSEQEIAETDRPVLLTNSTGETRAIGMTALYKEGLIKLKSRVRGVHEPK
ncbi:LPS export ABC transporter periplasmic protein LptC [Endozoicomonas sp. (ex Bugula neritina AB1)]|nr:LPS export ABC transporter periplasmic protein LptC [Endozoicomonas sp. (ex Bugula neritina AB1)]